MTLALVIFGSLDRRSGGYSYDTDLVDHLRRRGHGVEVWSLPEGRRQGAARILARRLAAEEPDVVVFDALVHPRITGLLERSRSRTLRVGLVHHPAWLEHPRPGPGKREQHLERRFLETMDAFLFNSEDTRQAVAVLRGAGATFKPSLVCHPPLEPVSATWSPTDKGRLLFLGNLIPRKNLHGLLKALALVAQRRSDLVWSLTVAGNSEVDRRYTKICRRLAESARLEDRITWVGRVDDAEREVLWSKTDLLTVPSFHEGWGMVHAEALVRGIAALAVPRGGITEVLGNAGLWSADHDSDSLARTLETFLESRVLREDLAGKSRLRGAALTNGFAALEAFLDNALNLKHREPVVPPFDFDAYLEAKAAIDSRSLHPRVLETALSRTPARILDLGGGTGTMAVRLRELGKIGTDTNYELVDLRAEGLKIARDRCEGLFSPGKFVTRGEDLLARTGQGGSGPDLVIAHAVLDLFDAETAARALAALRGRRYWFTHLFDGLTSWEPAVDPDLDRTLAAAYHRSMDERAPGRGGGSSRAGRDWLNALPPAGFRILDIGPSDWIVRPDDGNYLPEEEVFLRSILHFFRSSLAIRTDVDQAGLAWWLAVREAQVGRGEASLVVHQLDLAAELKEIMT